MKEEFDHKYDLINVEHNYFSIKIARKAFLKHSLKQGFLRVGLESQGLLRTRGP